MLQLRGPSRVSSICLARHEAMFLIREATELSHPEIVRKLGRTDHTSSMFACRKIQARIDEDPAYGDQLRSIAMISLAAQRETVRRDVAWLTQELAARKARLRTLQRTRSLDAKKAA